MTASETSLIHNSDALTDDYLPSDIVARNAQIAELRACLAPAADGRKPLHVWLHGRPGTGKTTVARFVASQLETNTRVEVAYINCWKHPTLFLVLQEIVEHFRIVVPDNANIPTKLRRIEKRLKGAPFVVVLDEFDKVQPKQQNAILYTLTEMNLCGIVAISNSRSTLLSLEDRVTSRLHPVFVGFEPFRPEELRLILEHRAKAALVPGSYNIDTLTTIAALAGGDARVAIQMMRKAAQLADTHSSRSISIEQVERSVHEARKLKARYTLGRLTDHHRLLVEIVESSKEIMSSDLWNAYLSKCADSGQRPIAERTFNAYVSSLASNGLIERGRAPTRGNVYVMRAAS